MNSIEDKIYINNVNQEVLNLVPNSASTILDLGCGGGVHAEYLLQKAPARHVDGITISPAEQKLAKKICRHVWLHNLELGLPEDAPEGSYDCILCSHVLEHLANPARLLEDAKRKLKADGVLVIAVPNLFFVRERIKILLGRFAYQKSGIWDDTHLRWYTWRSIETLVHQSGYRLIYKVGDGYLPTGRIRKLAPALCAKIDRALTQKWPGLFSWQFILQVKSCGLKPAIVNTLQKNKT